MQRYLWAALMAAAVGCSDNGGSGPPDLATGGGGDDMAVAGGGGDLAGGGGGMDLAGSGTDAFMCGASSFLMCSGNNAVYCNGTGDGTTSFDCGAACTGTSGCGQCTADSCLAGTLTPCDTTHGKTGTPTACVTLKAGGNVSMCADATHCQQCVGANVCGVGANANTSYSCSGGMLGAGTACAFGCDPTNGLCRDMVPANQAASHLAAADTFTCIGTQDATLAAVAASAGETLTFDTTARTIKTAATDYTANSKWGTAYLPTGGGTNVVVTHIKSINVAAGATVVVTGSSALVVLVDGDVALAGTSATPTIVKLAGSRTGGVGPGAPSLNGNGGASTGFIGGGGAGHGTVGGAGGKDSNGNAGGVAGALYGAADILEAGANGGTNGLIGGGAGGGGLQVSACGNLGVSASVVVNASGGGGRAGGGTGTTPAGGTGGGSGGTILFEAATFNAPGAAHTVAGTLAANGGGAGGGGDATNVGSPGGEWSPATAAATVAMGGASGTSNSGTGGNGGIAGTDPTAGGDAKSAANGGGGGGGAVGRIFLNASPAATAPTVASASPAPKTSSVCVTSNGAAPASCTYP